MKLSSQKDLLLVIIISGVVLILGWLGVLKGSGTSTIITILALFLPGYAIATAIWPDDESMAWTLRGGVGFVLGLIFVLFLPLIFNRLKLEYLHNHLYTLLFVLAILFSVLAMLRRRDEEEVPLEEGQLTLEESIELAKKLRKQADDHDEDHDEEYYLEEEESDETELDQGLENEEHIPYEMVEDLPPEDYYLDEVDTPKESVPLKVEKPPTTEELDYEAEMNKPIWIEELPEKKSGFKYWDLVSILLLTGISLLFLYFNPLKSASTSIIFFILLLFTMGYAGLTIVFPDKSHTRTRNLLLGIIITAIIIFVLSFLAWRVHILPNIPKFIVKILFAASIILCVGAFIRKWRFTPKDETHPEETLERPIPKPTEETLERPIPKQPEENLERPIPKTPEEPRKIIPVAESMAKDPDKKIQEEIPAEEIPEKKVPLANIGGKKETMENKKQPTKETPNKPRNYYMDILLVVAITLLTVAFVLIPPLNKTFIRTILGVLLVLFIPGYSLIAALFPKKKDLDGIERAALSFGLSIAVTPLIGLALNYTPWGIRLDPILVSLTIFTLAMATIAFLRRKGLSDEEKFFVPLGEFTRNIKDSFKGESRTERILSIILIISIVLAISTTVYIIVKPKEGEKFTEFYILGPDGKASNYPHNLTSGQTGSMIIGVVNHEYTTTDYRLVIKVNNITLKTQNLTLSSGEKVEIPYNYTPETSGQKKLEFLLYKLSDNATVYRSLHLWLNVT